MWRVSLLPRHVYVNDDSHTPLTVYHICNIYGFYQILCIRMDDLPNLAYIHVYALSCLVSSCTNNMMLSHFIPPHHLPSCHLSTHHLPSCHLSTHHLPSYHLSTHHLPSCHLFTFLPDSCLFVLVNRLTIAPFADYDTARR